MLTGVQPGKDRDAEDTHGEDGASGKAFSRPGPRAEGSEDTSQDFSEILVAWSD